MQDHSRGCDDDGRILAVSKSVSAKKDTHIEWTFAVPNDTKFEAGVYEIKFVRSKNDERDAGYPVLGPEFYGKQDATYGLQPMPDRIEIVSLKKEDG
jgi:hypothetical protein